MSQLGVVKEMNEQYVEQLNAFNNMSNDYNDLKSTFSPNQILNVLTSSTALFVNEIIVVFSNPTLLTSISSAYPRVF